MERDARIAIIAILATGGFQVIDGHVITSRKPDDIPAFTRAIIDQLSTP